MLFLDTAAEQEDLELINRTITLTPEEFGAFVIRIENDDILEYNESFILTLEAQVSLFVFDEGYSSVNIEILNDDGKSDHA